jgi:hypothetical protein
MMDAAFPRFEGTLRLPFFGADIQESVAHEILGAALLLVAWSHLRPNAVKKRLFRFFAGGTRPCKRLIPFESDVKFPMRPNSGIWWPDQGNQMAERRNCSGTVGIQDRAAIRWQWLSSDLTRRPSSDGGLHGRPRSLMN